MPDGHPCPRPWRGSRRHTSAAPAEDRNTATYSYSLSLENRLPRLRGLWWPSPSLAPYDVHSVADQYVFVTETGVEYHVDFELDSNPYTNKNPGKPQLFWDFVLTGIFVLSSPHSERLNYAVHLL